MRLLYLCLFSWLLLFLLPAYGAAVSLRDLPQGHALPAESRSDVPFLYELCKDSFRSRLHAACRDCAAVEFRTPLSCAAYGIKPVRRRVERAELEAAFEVILAVETWYARRTPPRMSVGRGNAPLIRFLDAEGRVLLGLAMMPACDGFAYDGSRYVSLWEIFARCLSSSRE